MIRILITADLSTKTIDKLNEIPEFEIIEKANINKEKLTVEIKNIDALILSGTTLLTPTILKSATSLKIIVLTGAGPNPLDTALARPGKIEIRSTTLAKNPEQEGLEVIVILKDFFNV